MLACSAAIQVQQNLYLVGRFKSGGLQLGDIRLCSDIKIGFRGFAPPCRGTACAWLPLAQWRFLRSLALGPVDWLSVQWRFLCNKNCAVLSLARRLSSAIATKRRSELGSSGGFLRTDLLFDALQRLCNGWDLIHSP